MAEYSFCVIGRRDASSPGNPQWKAFNGGNWEMLDRDVCMYANNKEKDLFVYTGGYDIAQLSNVNGTLTDLNLYTDSTENRAIPVPKFFWKIIYDRSTKKGTAFVGVNNPHLQNVTSDFCLCEDISSKCSWLYRSASSTDDGISYACTFDDMRKNVTIFPPIFRSAVFSRK